MTLTKIEWATRSDWNPVRGCTRVTEACRNCYAEIMAARFSKPGQWGHGFAHMVETPNGPDHRWTGKVELQEDRLTLPLRWKKPARIFVNSTSDIFHESLSDADIDKMFAVMALASQHTFMILTKRPERMRGYLTGSDQPLRVQNVVDNFEPNDVWEFDDHEPWVLSSLQDGLPNVWLGVSVHDQASADAFIPDLLATPAAIHFASYEPALGPINFRDIHYDGLTRIDALTGEHGLRMPMQGKGNRLRLIIAGGESGPGARPLHPDWVIQTRDDCNATDTAFFFKQWGEWAPHPSGEPVTIRQFNTQIAYVDRDTGDPKRNSNRHSDFTMRRVGKKAAGNHIDGRQWLELPAGAA